MLNLVLIAMQMLPRQPPAAVSKLYQASDAHQDFESVFGWRCLSEQVVSAHAQKKYSSRMHKQAELKSPLTHSNI